MTDIKLVVPEGMFGAYEGEDALTSFLRKLAVRATKFPELEDWPSKYGIDLNTAVFSMHTYCWCEKDDCPWCGPGCECPEGSTKFFWDLEEVSYREWVDNYKLAVYGTTTPTALKDYPDYDAKADAADLRRGIEKTAICEFCTVGWGCEYGAIPGYSAPNFWHKPSDFKVWWYKYIGRSMETDGPMPTDWEGLLKECLESIP